MTIRKDFIDLLESSLAFCGQREFTAHFLYGYHAIRGFVATDMLEYSTEVIRTASGMMPEPERLQEFINAVHDAAKEL